MSTDARGPTPSRARVRSLVGAATALACTLAASAPARAQGEPPRDPLAAEALYLAGRELLERGDPRAACLKFEASFALNVATSALINLAMCREREGRLAEAALAYRRALQQNRDTPGEARRAALDRIAREGLATLEPRLPRLRVIVDGPAPGSLAVRRDGLPLLPGALGELVPVDPGSHEITAEAAGFHAIRRVVSLGEGESETVALRLEPLAQGAPPTRAIPGWAWVSGGVGLALVGAGVAFRIDGASAESTLVARCGEALVCDPDAGYDPARDNARKNRDFGLFVGLTTAGALGVGAAVLGVALAPDPPDAALRVTPLVGDGGAGLALRGRL